MPTPSFTVDTPSVNMNAQAAGQVRIKTVDLNGAPVDVSSGYSINLAQALQIASTGVGATPVELVTDLSASFDTTGLFIRWTKAQATNMIENMNGCPFVLSIYLTNDGTTQSQVAILTVGIANIHNV